MLTLRPGSQAFLLVSLLAVTGEFPLRSLHLLGNERVLRELARRGSGRQVIRNSDGSAQIDTRLFQISGKGRDKSLRLYKGALSVLDWLHPAAYRYYMDSFYGHRFPGDSAHRDRNHRVAEAAAMLMRSGVEIRPYLLPALQTESIRQTVTGGRHTFYFARDLKKLRAGEQNKTMFTRTVGALFSTGSCYAVYNTRASAMKWNGLGEFKALHSLNELARMNAGVGMDSAILFGASEEMALATLAASAHPNRPEFRFDRIYPHIYFVPLDSFGARMLKLLLTPGRNGKMLNALFDHEDRVRSRMGLTEHDAVVGGVSVLSHFDGDIARLMRFREAAELYGGKYEVLCFPEQAGFVTEYMGALAAVRTITIDELEEAMGLET